MMRFGKKTQVAAGFVSLMVLAAVTSGCATTHADDGMAARIEAAANKAEMAANKAEMAAKSAADSAAKAQAAADKAEAIFHKHMKK